MPPLVDAASREAALRFPPEQARLEWIDVASASLDVLVDGSAGTP